MKAIRIKKVVWDTAKFKKMSGKVVFGKIRGNHY